MQTVNPNAMSDLSTWLCYLEQIHPKTIDMELERVKTVAMQLDLLKPAPYVFTVAGTNGKGTTCKTLEMILLAAGFNVGVYSSPHLLRFTERVRVNNQESSEKATVDSFVSIEKQRGDVSLTYFEYATLSALYQFKQAKLDVVILEVGLGGRLDATNIIDADITVITSIAIDHADYLGHTRESIGKEKAGIFKSTSIAVVGEPDMPETITDTANRIQCPLYAVNKQWSYYLFDNASWSFDGKKCNYENLPIPNVPLANAATAIAALTYSSLTISQSEIIEGLKKANLAGRFQQIQNSPMVILDVAHNPHAAMYLQTQIDCLQKSSNLNGKTRFVMGMLKDKDIRTTLSMLSGNVWYCASLYGERGCDASVLTEYLKQSGKTDIQSFDTVKQAFEKAILDADEMDTIIVCGSFHTVAEVMAN